MWNGVVRRLFSTASQKNVVVALSGGVDSAVTALRVLKEGHKVTGVHMQNWDARDEDGRYCTAERDLRDAQTTADTLGIPLTVVNFSQHYWQQVFEPFLDDIRNARTPNPDIVCNRSLKFSVFAQHCREELGADAIATGHYARLRCMESDCYLLRGIDTNMDQSYFLSQVPHTALRHFMFPLGELYKADVREMASEAGLTHVSEKKSSVGLCFVGKRPFKEFISQYIDDRRGAIIDVETRQRLGAHRGLHLYTIGQAAKLGGASQAYFVCGKRASTNALMVCAGSLHPALLYDEARVQRMVWINERHEAVQRILGGERVRCRFIARYRQLIGDCYVSLLPSPTLGTNEDVDVRLLVEFASPLRAATPGQVLVLYSADEDVCLGGGELEDQQRSRWTTKCTAQAGETVHI